MSAMSTKTEVQTLTVFKERTHTGSGGAFNKSAWPKTESQGNSGASACGYHQAGRPIVVGGERFELPTLSV